MTLNSRAALMSVLFNSGSNILGYFSLEDKENCRRTSSLDDDVLWTWEEENQHFFFFNDVFFYFLIMFFVLYNTK